MISKTTFPEFQMCPKNAWLKLHKPELLEQLKVSDFELHLVEQGREVELAAQALWNLMASRWTSSDTRRIERLLNRNGSAQIRTETGYCKCRPPRPALAASN